jgi:hypothetical protein
VQRDKAPDAYSTIGSDPTRVSARQVFLTSPCVAWPDSCQNLVWPSFSCCIRIHISVIKEILMLLAVFRMKWSGKLTTWAVRRSMTSPKLTQSQRFDPQGAFTVDACFSWLVKRYGNSRQSHAIK